MLTQRPTVLGLTLCEDVAADPTTRNLSLLRSFTGLVVDGFPAIARPFCVFAALTDGFGQADAELRVDLLDEQHEEVYRVPSQLRFGDRLRIVYYVMRLSRCPFPRAGTYLLALWLDGEWCAQHSLRVYALESN